MFGFSFSATPTPESCSGNGTISFSTFNTNPNGTIVFIIYKLPNVLNPYSVINTNLLSGLSAGTYRIVAKETVGNVSTEQQVDVLVDLNQTSLVYTIQSLNQACSNTSNISVTIVSGTAQSYEIFAGPIHFPIQSSNTFSGLPVGVYKIRVFDICGVGTVQTFTVNQNTAGINIGSPSFSNTAPPSCNFTVATNTISAAAGTVLGYPLSITYTIHPPGGGAPIIQVINLTNGNATSQNLIATIPDYVGQNFDYDITIVDACNSTYTQNFPVIKDITITSTITNLECDQNYFSLQVANYTPPFNLNFTSFPAGFNPNALNANYPGPYNQNTIQFGDINNFTPFGDYTVVATDSCGRTITNTFTISSQPPVPSVTTSNNGCLTNSGTIIISIPNYPLINAVITSAPPGYPQPSDVSSSIDANGVLTLTPVPIGDYVIQLIDKCNISLLPFHCTVPVYVDKGLAASNSPGCDIQKTSISLSSKNGKLTTVTITAAPAAYGHIYPYDVSANIISNGNLYLDDLPGGTYSFAAIDECGFNNSITVIAPGYTYTSSFSLQPNCGSFDLPLNFVSNGTTNQTFWLQKLINPATNSWGHPDYPNSGNTYPNGSVPNASNSLSLVNNATNFNKSYNGTFRIVRNFSSYNNGINYNNGNVTSVNKQCLEILSPTLEFHQAIEITDARRIPCTVSGNPDVVISSNGTPPLLYSITTKNGAPFFLNNGNSNIFYNLAPAVYTVQVEDSCGNIRNRICDVPSLLSLVNITKPNNILQCKTIITGNEVFDLTQQSATILSSQSPTDYTLTYYTSMSDAMSATNPITNLTSFHPTSNPQTIYVRLIFNGLPNCYETTSFDLMVGQKPLVTVLSNYLNCYGTAIILILPIIYQSLLIPGQMLLQLQPQVLL